MFEPAGEECGTQYDYANACPNCGAGRRLSSPLILDMRRAPRNADLAFTIARDEYVLARRLADMLWSERVTGPSIRPIQSPTAPDSKEWMQLVFESQPVRMAALTEFGDNPLLGAARDTQLCDGHVAGPQILSELYLRGDSWTDSDWTRTAELVGLRGGLVAPYALFVISQRFWQLLQRSEFTGFRVEVAHIV
jgi:hypothetical protein